MKDNHSAYPLWLGTTAALWLIAMPHTASAGPLPGARTGALEEVVVTAQKREEDVQSTPVPVTVLNADSLAALGQVQLRDFNARVPGFQVTSNGGSQFLSIRGVTTGGGNPTVGISIDDAPYGGSTSRVGGGQVPDIDPGDLARIEILRGPQGTLYGAASMGGLLKFVTKSPSLDSYSGRVEAGLNSIRNANDLGYSVRGAFNVPVSETFAVRASGFTRLDPGYIDNPTLQRDGVNEVRAHGARFAALWQPSDDLSLKLSALYQQTDGDAQSAVYRLPGLVDLQRSDIAGVGQYERTAQAYSALLNWNLGSVNLTSVTAFNTMRYDDSQDYSSAINATRNQALFGVTGAGLHSQFTNDRFAQELRLSAMIGEKLEWLVGAFYDNEQGPYTQQVYAQNPTTGQIVGQWADLSNPGKFEEYAAFANLTYHFSDRVDVQVGARRSRAKSTGETSQVGPLIGPTPLLIPPAEAKEDSFTYLVTPRYRISDNLMVYARLATGYRPGGFNRALPATPLAFEPDETTNYEIGVKGEFLDRAVSVDASVYYIDWDDIQIQLVNPSNFNYMTNGSAAKSEGAEIAVQTRPLTGLTIAAWVAYSDAALTERFPVGSTAYGVPGSELPFNRRWSGDLSVRQDFSVSSRMTGYVEGVLTYVGERTGLFRGLSAGVPLPRDVYPSYTRTDLRAGFVYDTWEAGLFANNLTDRRGIVGGGAGFFPAFSYAYIQPRTVGLSVAKSF